MKRKRDEREREREREREKGREAKIGCFALAIAVPIDFETPRSNVKAQVQFSRFRRALIKDNIDLTLLNARIGAANKYHPFMSNQRYRLLGSFFFF